MTLRHHRAVAATATALVLAFLAVLAPTMPARAGSVVSGSYAPASSWWGTNGRVADILVSGNRVYLAGGFDYVGPTTGHGVAVDGVSGLVGASPWPSVDGPVDASVPDGSGGWYLAGRFKTVGGTYRPGAAQVTRDGQVTAWNPRPGGRVLALATTADAVVLGGEFLTIGKDGVAAARLAAVDRSAGELLPTWTAQANAPVRSLLSTESGLYAGGDFTTVNAVARTGLVRLDTVTGAVDPSFAGEARGSVRAMTMALDGTTLYVGGTFTAVAAGATTLTRFRLAGFTTDSGTPLPWAPAADGVVNALTTDTATGTVFVGGLFSRITGVPRPRLAGLSSSGEATDFNPGLNGCHVRHTTGYAHANPPCTPEVGALAARDGVLYVGGRFGRSGLTVRHDAAAYATATGALTSWDPTAGDRVNTITPTDGGVFLGGEFTSVNGQVRKGVAALNATTGQLDPTFTASTDNTVLDLALSTDGTRLYLAGSFLTVQGLPRTRLASVLVATGAVDPYFKPSVNNDVLSIAYSQGWLFAGGKFTVVNGIARSHTVKLSGTTGAVNAYFRADTVGPTGALRAGGMVQSLVVSPDGGLLFIAGPFLTVNGRSIAGGIAVHYASTGLVHPRQLGGVRGCTTAGPWINRLYLSPDGRRLYGGDVCPDYIYQWDAINLSSTTRPTGLLWRTWCNGGMQGALELDGRFYYGTHGNTCSAAPGSAIRLSRPRLAVFAATNAALQSDNPVVNSAMGVWAINRTASGLLVGGDFTLVNSTMRQGFAFIPLSTSTP